MGAQQVRSAARGMTLLEVLISSALVLVVIGSFLGGVRLCSQSTAFHTAIAQQVRKSEQLVDEMLIALRWISVKDPELQFSFPSGTSTDVPRISFRRLKDVSPEGAYVWGDRVTYYWLPSASENSKYETGALALFSAVDIDGEDHDLNGIANDGVIWRKVEDADGDGKLENLGYDSFSGTLDLRPVFMHVPPPFQRISGVVTPLDCFKVDVSRGGRSVTLTLKRFIDTGQSTISDMAPRPENVPLTESALKSQTVTVMTTQRTFCIRN